MRNVPAALYKVLGGFASAIFLLVVVALMVFGSVFLAGLPMLTALVGAAATMLAITAATGFVKLSSTTPLLALMIVAQAGHQHIYKPTEALIHAVERWRDGDMTARADPGGSRRSSSITRSR